MTEFITNAVLLWLGLSFAACAFFVWLAGRAQDLRDTPEVLHELDLREAQARRRRRELAGTTPHGLDRLSRVSREDFTHRLREHS